jgi:hypothetical protein
VRALSALSVLLIAGFLSAIYYCGRKSGQWENDSGNWERAFGTPPPGEIQVIHSFYDRSPHPILLEHHFAFHIKSSLSPALAWVDASNLTKLDPRDTAKLELLKSSQPPWFAPRKTGDYEIYILQDEPFTSFGIFIDRELSEWFVTDRS